MADEKTAIKMLTDYREFFKAGDVVQVPSECNLSKAEELVELGRAEWVVSGSIEESNQDDAPASPDESWLKADLVAYAKVNGINPKGTKADILKRIAEKENDNG